jgi:hypothetical protein
MTAVMKNHQEIVEFLLNYGANPRIENHSGETALSMAVIQENFNICEVLLIARARVDQRDNQGRTPLHRAAKYNKSLRIIELFVKYGAQIDPVDHEYCTPLHHAAASGLKEAAKYFVKLGANPYAINRKSLVPYEEVLKDDVRPSFQFCVVCKKMGGFTCQHCQAVFYCDSSCQKKDFLLHRRFLCEFFQDRSRQAAWAEQARDLMVEVNSLDTNLISLDGMRRKSLLPIENDLRKKMA